MLAQKAGQQVVPERVPKSDEEMLAVADDYWKRGAANECCVIKVHMPLDDRPDLKVIYMTRDLRDRIFSFCRFGNTPLTEQVVLTAATRSLEMDAHYARWPSSEILSISFDSLENDSLELIHRIADFMGLRGIGDEKLNLINAELGKNQVKKRSAYARCI
jgi:hypothetical protein